MSARYVNLWFFLWHYELTWFWRSNSVSSYRNHQWYCHHLQRQYERQTVHIWCFGRKAATENISYCSSYFSSYFLGNRNPYAEKYDKKKNMMKNMIEICSAERRKSKLRLVQIGGFRMFETFRRSMMMTIPVNSIFKSNSKKELEGNN